MKVELHGEMREKDTSSEAGALEQEILEYLVEHPEAKDTLEGIMDWWLPRARSRVRPEEVKSVLEQLVARNWMTATSAGPAAVVYGLQKEHFKEICRFLVDRPGKS